MSDTYRVAIIGGGIVGVSTAYHLAERGETNVVVLERAELTSGSTWHAAGNLPHFAGSFNMMKLHQHSKQLYRKLEDRHGDIGMHLTGSLRLAHNRDRMDEFHRIAAMARQNGVEMAVMSVDDIRARWPWLEVHDLLGGLWDALDGHIDPTSVTNAMAADARAAGVTIRRNAPVQAIERADSGRWTLETSGGTVSAEVIVNAAGFRAPEVAAMVGHDIPISSMEHQYLVTEEIPDLAARDDEIPMIRDPDTSYYLRQERQGVIIGPYEHDGVPWATGGVPAEFGQELLPPDLDRIAEHVADAMERVPMAAEAGIKTIINGPISYTPDGLPLIGPVAGIDNCFLNCGSSFGITQGGGSGLFGAEWILDGHTSLDMWELDPRRFGDWASPEWVQARCKDIYDHEYAHSFPHEWAGREAGRPVRRTPASERHEAAGAVFSTAFGWERPAFFAAGAAAQEDHFTFRRADWQASVDEECRAVRERVGLLDLSGFAKFDVNGPGAQAMLDSVGANAMPNRTGGIVLTHALTPTGGVLSEFTVTRMSDDHFYVVSAAAAELHDLDLLCAALPGDGSATIENINTDWGTFVLAGPEARNLLAKLTDADLSNDAFPWLNGRKIEVAGMAVRALRVNYVGELGWELHHRIGDQLALYDAIADAGARFGLAPFGLRAMDSLRLEKMYRGWRTDLSTEYSLVEAGMERFARLDKNGTFTGREALQAHLEKGPPNRLVCLEVDSAGADCISSEPVLDGEGAIIGTTTSGGYAHHLGKSLAIAYVRSDLARDGVSVAVDILGERRPARVHLQALYDPGNERLRS
jgi:dimethylglycine dehydrogenase